MSESAGSGRRPALLNALLGMALLAAAGLAILLLAEIGRAAWERARLAERWQALSRSAPAAQDEAGALREAVAGAEHAASELQRTLASDADVARFVAGIPASAAAWGVTVTQLSPQAPTPAAAAQRSFALTAQGPGPDLQGFVARLAETAPAGARIEALSLRLASDPCTLELTLTIPIRQSSP